LRFDLVDAVLEQSADRIVTIKHVSAAEEYLQDHFPGFPVLPGVLMIEAMVQSARRLCSDRFPQGRLVLGGVRALKYGRFVRPGDTLRIEVTVHRVLDDNTIELKGEGLVVGAGGTAPLPDSPAAVSGRFVLRPLMLGLPA
jgi:3-hydroxyacyl-[acyl-carrier-protein] dehydratase